jgi:hypothetical protein
MATGFHAIREGKSGICSRGEYRSSIWRQRFDDHGDARPGPCLDSSRRHSRGSKSAQMAANAVRCCLQWTKEQQCVPSGHPPKPMLLR